MTARVQNSGLANITAGMSAYASVPKYIQWGTSSGAPATQNAVTTTSTTESRTSGTPTQQTTTVASDTLQIQGVITALAVRAITEAGCFDAAGSGNPPTGGNMCLYGDFSVINLNTNDSIQFTFQVKFQ